MSGMFYLSRLRLSASLSSSAFLLSVYLFVLSFRFSRLFVFPVFSSLSSFRLSRLFVSLLFSPLPSFHLSL